MEDDDISGEASPSASSLSSSSGVPENPGTSALTAWK